MKKLIIIIAISFSILAPVKPIMAAVLTFENLYPGYETWGQMPLDYQGFIWDWDTVWVTKHYYPGTGFEEGTIGHVSIYNSYFDPINISSTTPFNFEGAFITAAAIDNDDVVVSGWLGNTLKYSETIFASIDQRHRFNFSFSDIDKLVFDPGNRNTGSHFVVDNIVYNTPVPEPATLSLLGLGLLGLVFRRKKASN